MASINLIKLTDIIAQDNQKKSYNNSLAGEIEDEWGIEPSLLINIKFQSFLFLLIKEYIRYVKLQFRPEGTHLECSDEDFIKMNMFFHGEKKWKISRAWFNDQKDNEYNPTHNHNGIISGVLYLKIPEYLSPRKNKHTDGAITFFGNSYR